MWQWFLKWGDKLLAFATAVVALMQTQNALDPAIMKWVLFGLAVATLAHNTFLPEPTPAPVAGASKI